MFLLLLHRSGGFCNATRWVVLNDGVLEFKEGGAVSLSSLRPHRGENSDFCRVTRVDHSEVLV